MLARIKDQYNDYNPSFWVLMGSTFIDRVGNFMLFPFFTLYMTEKFEVGLTEAGYLFTIFAATNLFGGILGGALADKLGRKKMLIFGLIMSATGNLALAFVEELSLFYIVSAVSGLLGSASFPAQDAMVADLLPKEKLTEGYGIRRVVENMAVVIGPMIGGFLASISFIWLFVGGAITSYITAWIAYKVLPETKPEKKEDEPEESFLETLKGYRVVFADTIFMIFLALTIFQNIAYFQMNSAMPVYLRDVHGIPPLGYAYILMLNAAMVVLFQLKLARRIRDYAPMLMMSLGCAIYAIGFTMYGFVSGIYMFAFGMVIITIGEMFVSPVTQSLVATLAPEEMRGRYMAVGSIRWLAAIGLGPLLGGIVLDNYDPNWVWYGAGIVLLVTSIGFIFLHMRAKDHLVIEPQTEPVV